MKSENIESVDVILSNKESIFEEPFVEYEMFAITDNFDEWKQLNIDNIEFDYYKTTPIYTNDLDAVAKKFDMYMLAPTAKYGIEILTARTKKFKSLDDVSVDKNMVLYRLFILEDEYVVRYGLLGEMN